MRDQVLQAIKQPAKAQLLTLKYQGIYYIAGFWIQSDFLRCNVHNDRIDRVDVCLQLHLSFVFEVPYVSWGAYYARPARPRWRLDVSLQRGCYPHQKAGINVLGMILDARRLVSCGWPTGATLVPIGQLVAHVELVLDLLGDDFRQVLVSEMVVWTWPEFKFRWLWFLISCAVLNPARGHRLLTPSRIFKSISPQHEEPMEFQVPATLVGRWSHAGRSDRPGGA